MATNVAMPTCEHESALIADGLHIVAGIDEAGRGPLAGPVVAAAVVLPPGLVIPGLTDSKKLDAAARDRLFDVIGESAQAVGVGRCEADEIDQLNILRATLTAMRRALDSLGLAVDAVLIDGNQRLPGLACHQVTLVKGDSRSMSIAAASIVAKVTRDREMCRLDTSYPGYGFAGHKGYPAPSHLAALSELGPCPVHRRSFGPVRALLADPPPLPPARSRGASATQLSLFENDDAR
ncbi:MAG: ribonuclease HII [Armatimonadetes bacterium]|nr:ribonuclease HII [Armatimonadota bacterium]